MADIQALRASKNQAKSNTDWPRFSLFFNKVLLISKQNNFQKKILFSHQCKKCGWQKYSQNLKSWKNLNIRRQYLMVLSWSHPFVMVSVFWAWKCNVKKKKRTCEAEMMPQNHRKCDFLAFSYWNLHWYPKDHIVERKDSENSPLALTNLIQIVM